MPPTSLESVFSLYKEIPVNEPVLVLAISPDKKTILTEGRTARSTIMQLWSTETGAFLNTFHGNGYMVTKAVFSPDGKIILSGLSDGTVQLWDVESGVRLKRFKKDISSISSVAFSPNGKIILTGSYDAKARLWDIESDKELKIFEEPDSVLSVAFSPDGTKALTGTWDNAARLRDVESGNILKEFKGHTGPIASVAFSSDGKTIFTASKDKTIRSWNAETGKQLTVLELETPGEVFQIELSLDGKTVLVNLMEESGNFYVYDLPTSKKIATLDLIFGALLSPDGSTIIGTKRMKVKGKINDYNEKIIVVYKRQ